MQYNDFTILIESDGAGGFCARAESDYGEPEPTPFSLPDDVALDELRQRFEARTTDRQYLESVGRDLYHRLFAGKTDATFLLCLGAVGDDPETGLRIRLRIRAPELAALPWELLYSDLDEAFLCTRIKTPLVRYLDMAAHRGELSTPYPLRMLVLIPAGGIESTRLDAAKERSIIESSVADLGKKIKLTFLHDDFEDGKVTWQRVADSLATTQFHCVHFVGHGAFRDDHGYLVLDGENDEGELVEDERFAEAFVNAPSVKLVVLNACNGATSSSSRPLAGSAARLVRRGVPAVVAMQFSILDDAAITFARSFYRSLFTGGNHGRVDVAVSRGRQMLAARFADQRELAAPVLFIHAKGDVVLVPESKGLIRNLPRSSEQLDTLHAARDATPSESEAAKFSRRITIARSSLQTGVAVGLLLFLMSAVRVLDIFTLDTQADFAVMALGNGLTEHSVSDRLRVLTIAGEGLLTRQLRERTADIIRALNDAEAQTVALDMFFRAEQGAFSTDPESGPLLAEAIREAGVPVVVGAIEAGDGRFEVPDSIREAAADIGYICHESKLGLARSLPISAVASGTPYSSFALAAVATFMGGNVLPGLQAESTEPVLAFSNKPSIRFAVSEVNDVRRKIPTCPLISSGDRVAHRFVRRTPEDLLASITMSDQALIEVLTTDPESARNLYSNTLVLVGVLGRGDIVFDRAGPRDGVMWQADAINNLLLDEEIVPMRDRYQLLLMMLLAVSAIAGSLQLPARGAVQGAFLATLSAAIVGFSVYLYGRHGILLSPLYCLLAILVAWLIAKRLGRKWLLNG